mmetsp:Transcript_20798/g.31760  ORF Transcript_20798/g.31760 Transcript_20798/m.31760 type:complete len:100 (+) Transcript_20798:236-535(+)
MDCASWAIGSEHQPARNFCCSLIGIDHSTINSYFSNGHGRQIDLTKVLEFLFPTDQAERNQKLRDAMKQKLNPHLGAIRKVSSGECTLESETGVNQLRI